MHQGTKVHDANLQAIFDAGNTEAMTGGSVMSRKGGDGMCKCCSDMEPIARGQIILKNGYNITQVIWSRRQASDQIVQATHLDDR